MPYSRLAHATASKALVKLYTGENQMNTKQSQKSQTTQKEPTQALWTELSDDQSAQLAGGASVVKWVRDNARGWGWAYDPFYN